MEGYEVEHEFPGLGQRTMLLNARQVFYEGGPNITILLGIEDVTDRIILEREKETVHRQFEESRAFAQAIVDTVREPFLVLDKELRVIAASRSFYSAFKVKPDDTQGRLLYALGDGQWDIPKLRVLLEKIIPEKGVMEGYEVEHEFPGLGQRTMLLERPPGVLRGRRQHHHSARHRGRHRPAHPGARKGRAAAAIRRKPRVRAGDRRYRARTFPGARPRPARARRQPLVLLGLQGQARRHPGQAALRLGRRPMGHSQTAFAAGKDRARTRRDGRLRGRARIPRPRPTHDAA